MNSYPLRASHYFAAAIGLTTLLTVIAASFRAGAVQVPYVSRLALTDIHLSWVVGYTVIALAVTALVTVAANAARPTGVAGPEHPVPLLIVAGLCWPMLCVGLVQLGIVAALGFRARGSIGRTSIGSGGTEPITRSSAG